MPYGVVGGTAVFQGQSLGAVFFCTAAVLFGTVLYIFLSFSSCLAFSLSPSRLFFSLPPLLFHTALVSADTAVVSADTSLVSVDTALVSEDTAGSFVSVLIFHTVSTSSAQQLRSAWTLMSLFQQQLVRSPCRMMILEYCQ